MTEKEREELKALVKTWNKYVCYATDTSDYPLGYESGMQNAAYDLESWLSNH